MNVLLNTGAGWGYEMTPAELTRKDQFLKRKPNDNNASQATSQALYDLDHPREYVPKSIEVQQVCMKEREFYVAFLEELEKLKVKI